MTSSFQMPRRAFLAATALSATAAQLAAITPAFAQPAGALKRLEPLKSIEANGLSMGYFEAGPANGAPVILLHGWPYDIH
ncbi:alpha/beta hydrolase, partial [Variovorax paradoxus]